MNNLIYKIVIFCMSIAFIVVCVSNNKKIDNYKNALYWANEVINQCEESIVINNGDFIEDIIYTDEYYQYSEFCKDLGLYYTLYE